MPLAIVFYCTKLIQSIDCMTYLPTGMTCSLKLLTYGTLEMETITYVQMLGYECHRKISLNQVLRDDYKFSK